MALNRIFYLILVSFILGNLSCNYYGYYKYHGNKDNPDKIFLTINKDSSFIFHGWSDIIGETINNGKWLKKKDTLILIKYNNTLKTYQVMDYYRVNYNKIVIKVKDGTDLAPIAGAIVVINKDTLYTDSYGEISLNKQSINDLELSYLNFKKKICFKNNSNLIQILLYTKKFEKAHLYLNDRWLIRYRKLIPLDDSNRIITQSELIK